MVSNITWKTLIGFSCVSLNINPLYQAMDAGLVYPDPCHYSGKCAVLPCPCIAGWAFFLGGCTGSSHKGVNPPPLQNRRSGDGCWVGLPWSLSLLRKMCSVTLSLYSRMSFLFRRVHWLLPVYCWCEPPPPPPSKIADQAMDAGLVYFDPCHLLRKMCSVTLSLYSRMSFSCLQRL